MLMLICSQQIGQTADVENKNLTRFVETIQANRYQLVNSNNEFSGPAWDYLLKNGQTAQFFLLGEEHGIAENPAMAAALFKQLSNQGYQHFAIEVSPQMASKLQAAASQGFQALQNLYKEAESRTAFFGMQEEAQMLVDVMSVTNAELEVLWGLDYEVLADHYLINQLHKNKLPKGAQSAVDKLKQEADSAALAFKSSQNPKDIFSFSADPVWVQNVIDAWQDIDVSSMSALHTLLETYSINQLWVKGQGWQSNLRRAHLLKQNFLTYWQKHKEALPKVFFKLGSSHMIRGLNHNNVYDLGTLIPEIATSAGSHAFQLLVLPGQGSSTAVFNPSTMIYETNEPKDSYSSGMDLLFNEVFPQNYTLFDLRPLRSMAKNKLQFMTAELIQTIHGYDALLIMSGSQASTNINQKLTKALQ